jgi:hypothetical protein
MTQCCEIPRTRLRDSPEPGWFAGRELCEPDSRQGHHKKAGAAPLRGQAFGPAMAMSGRQRGCCKPRVGQKIKVDARRPWRVRRQGHGQGDCVSLLGCGGRQGLRTTYLHVVAQPPGACGEDQSGSSPTLRVGATGNANAEQQSSTANSRPMPLNIYAP